MTQAFELSLSDEWFVTNGVVAVGPVAFELLLRGVAYGRIPSTSLVRHASWQVWRRLDEIEQLSGPHRQQTIEDLATISASLEERAKSKFSEPPPPPSGELLAARAISVAPTSRQSFRPTAVDPVGVLSNAKELLDGMLLTISTAVMAAAADVGLVHRLRSDLHAAVTVGGHGPGSEQLLGERLAEDDPTLIAARGGHTVIAEPSCGEIGRHMLGRISRCVPDAKFGAMVPFVLYGHLVALFEIGRVSQPFRAREIARVEDVVEALAERAVVMGWIE